MPSQGNCYLCGKTLGKVAMKNHLLKAHNDTEGDQRCYLLKAEGLYDKDYWLYFDIPVSSNLSAVDQFLRNIWLECCGHMSIFTGPGYQEIGKNKKLYNFSVGTQLVHEYDFGSTTESKITFASSLTKLILDVTNGTLDIKNARAITAQLLMISSAVKPNAIVVDFIINQLVTTNKIHQRNIPITKKQVFAAIIYQLIRMKKDLDTFGKTVIAMY